MKALRRLLLPGLFFLCLFLSSTASQQIQELPNLYTLIQEERTFTGKEALEMQRNREGKKGRTASKQQDKQSVPS